MRHTNAFSWNGKLLGQIYRLYMWNACPAVGAVLSAPSSERDIAYTVERTWSLGLICIALLQPRTFARHRMGS